MSTVHFFYNNLGDDATVQYVSSELSSLPASNVQNDILSKVWRTDSAFVVGQHNYQLTIHESGTYYQVPVASGSYTGSGLASAIQTAMNSVLTYNYSVKYNGTTYKFTFAQTNTSLGFSLIGRYATYPRTITPLIGFVPPVGNNWTGTSSVVSPATAKGAHHELILDMSATNAITAVIVAGHNLSLSSTVVVRGAGTVAILETKPWLTSSNTLYQHMTYGSGTIIKEFDSVSVIGIALDIYDPKTATVDVGRVFVGTYFEPEGQLSNTISWSERQDVSRTQRFVSHAGVTYFDRRNNVPEYVWRPPPLNEYYNPTTKTGFEAMRDAVGNWKPLFISFDSTQRESTTVFGYFVNNFRWMRQGLSPSILLEPLTIREQL